MTDTEREHDNEILGKCDSTMSEIVTHAITQPGQYYFQPIVNVESNTTVGFEMLSRAMVKGCSERINISTLFDKIDSKTRFNFDLFTIKNAIKTIKDTENNKFYLTVNVEPDNLQHNYFFDHVERMLADEGVHNLNGRIIIEITERIKLDLSGSLVDNLKKLKALGFMLAMDDFGSGYSNLKRLSSLPIDILKLDGYFVKNLNVSHKHKLIVDNIVHMANELGFSLIAEQVEEKEQILALQKSNVTYFQGFYLGRPSPSLMSKFTIL